MTPQEAVEFCRRWEKSNRHSNCNAMADKFLALRKVIEDQQREVERLSSLANRALCDIDCTACDRWLNDSAKMNGNGELYCAECYESEREAWL